MTILPEEAVKAAEKELINSTGDFTNDVHRALTAAAPHLAAVRVKAQPNITRPIVGIENRTAQEVFDIMRDRILSALEPAATCNESLQVEPAAPEGQQPVADALELSGNTGELIDRMAAAIRDWGSHYDDGPWEALPEDRKAGWRGDAERALAVAKEYLTARRPSEQAVTEAMVDALKRIRDTAMKHTITARIPECGVFGCIAQDADWLMSEITAAMEAGL